MTKRAYPFEAGVLRQFKIHINNIDCDKASRKEIENKTMEKLFSAQKNCDLSNYNNNFEAYVDGKGENLKQKLVSCYFGLKNSHELQKNAVQNLVGNEVRICSYCDSQVEYSYKCSSCFEDFCHLCSFADYSVGNEEGRICITCSC